MNYGYLIDVFFTGPLQIYVSTHIKNSAENNDTRKKFEILQNSKYIFLRFFMLVTGIMTILYNGHNFLLFNNIIKQPIKIFKKIVHLKYGKYQIHRIYNLSIMYPIFTYVLINTPLSKVVYILFLINIIFGFLINLFFLYNIH